MDKVNEILEYLREFHTEENNAISAEELAVLYNSTKRGLRMIVTELRKEGYPVCSSNSGYWYSENAEDLRKTIARLEAQTEHMQLAVAGLKKAGGIL